MCVLLVSGVLSGPETLRCSRPHVSFIVRHGHAELHGLRLPVERMRRNRRVLLSGVAGLDFETRKLSPMDSDFKGALLFNPSGWLRANLTFDVRVSHPR